MVKNFTKDELEEHLTNIECFWGHRGDEEQYALETYLKQLFFAATDGRASSPEEFAAQLVKLDREPFFIELKRALEAIYTSEETEEEAKAFFAYMGVAEGESAIITRRNLEDFFNLHFGEDTFTDEVLENLESLRHWLSLLPQYSP